MLFKKYVPARNSLMKRKVSFFANQEEDQEDNYVGSINMSNFLYKHCGGTFKKIFVVLITNIDRGSNINLQ